MGTLAALKAKSREIGYGGDRDMVVGAVIAPEVIVHLTAADMHIDYDAALLVVQSLKARQYGDLVSRQSYSSRMLSNYILLHIASGRCVYVCLWSMYVCVVSVCVYVCGRCMCMWSVCVWVLVVGNASMIDLLLYVITVCKIAVNLA